MGNCSGMEAMTVVITFHTNYHRASKLLILSLEVRIYIDGDLF